MDSPIFSMELFVAKGRLLCIFIAAPLILSANCSAPASHEAKKVAKDPARIADALRQSARLVNLRVSRMTVGAFQDFMISLRLSLTPTTNSTKN
jgi:hypothetical protein